MRPFDDAQGRRSTETVRRVREGGGAMNNETALCECPKCGCTDGYYTKERQTYYMYYHFGEEEPYESEQSTNGYGGTVMYCIACDARIGTMRRWSDE